MVMYCVAFGCKNEYDYRKISFHSFPFKRPDILELWIKAVRRENWTPSRSSKLCGDHFLPTDYMVKPGCTAKRLKPNAVPSVFSYPKHLLPQIAKVELSVDVCREDVSSNTITPINIDLPSTSTSSQVGKESSVDVCREDVNSNTITPIKIDLPSTSISSQVGKLIDRETQTMSCKDTSLRRKVKTLKQKVRRRDVKISNLIEVIHSLLKSRHSNENTCIEFTAEGCVHAGQLFKIV